MIEEKNVLVAEINNQVNIAANLNIPTDYIKPLTQEKSVIPDKRIIFITPDDGYTGLSKVTVNKIPDEYIVPTGKIEIIQNGTYDVTDKASAIVNVPEKNLGTKTITTNGTYKASDDNLDGYSQVEVETSGVDINEYMSDTVLYSNWTEIPKWVTMILQLRNPIKYSRPDLSRLFMWYQGQKTPKLEVSNITNTSNMFAYCFNLEEIGQFNSSNVTDMSLMFYNCTSLKTIPQFDTSKVNNMNMMFSGCYNLTTVPQLNANKVQYISGAFSSCSALENLGALLNLGEAYNVGTSANNYSYALQLNNSPKLTHDSLINVINGLYDIKTKGCNAQSLKLGSTNLAKLTSEEIAIATEKGWNVS